MIIREAIIEHVVVGGNILDQEIMEIFVVFFVVKIGQKFQVWDFGVLYSFSGDESITVTESKMHRGGEDCIGALKGNRRTQSAVVGEQYEFPEMKKVIPRLE